MEDQSSEGGGGEDEDGEHLQIPKANSSSPHTKPWPKRMAGVFSQASDGPKKSPSSNHCSPQSPNC